MKHRVFLSRKAIFFLVCIVLCGLVCSSLLNTNEEVDQKNGERNVLLPPSLNEVKTTAMLHLQLTTGGIQLPRKYLLLFHLSFTAVSKKRKFTF